MRVPEGWAKMKIGDLCQPDSEQVSVAPDQTYKLMGVRWYGNGPHLHSEVLGEKLNTSTLNLIKEGRITYNKMWVSKSAFGVTSANHRGMYATAEYPTFVPSSRLCVDFLRHYMKLESFRDQALSRCRGTTSRARLNPNDFLDLQILLPPLSEQRRIAELLSSVEEAIAVTQAVIEQSRRLRNRGLCSLFPQNLREGAGDEWLVMLSEDICTDIIDCKNRTPPRAEKGFPVIRTPNVRSGQFVEKDLHFTDAASFLEWTKKGKPRTDDILFTREAPYGEVCLAPKGDFCLGQRMMFFRPNKKIIESEYLLYAMQSEVVQKQLRLLAGGSTVGHLRVKDVRRIPIPVPSQDIQRKIARLFVSIDHDIERNNRSLDVLNRLKSALMSDLLTGRKRVSADALSPAL